ncbi:DUF397 domain-containing protein [Streptomyces sp. NPDC050504]|uniref:DUF397 domain-containing protein n=1 Tax=Streptomyces sp. NPDC050504 TaxID=3365618 RepID=UPI00378A5D3C
MPAHPVVDVVRPSPSLAVEWLPGAATTDAVPVRDSKTPHGARLTPSAHAWQTFIDGFKG